MGEVIGSGGFDVVVVQITGLGNSWTIFEHFTAVDGFVHELGTVKKLDVALTMHGNGISNRDLCLGENIVCGSRRHVSNDCIFVAVEIVVVCRK